MTIQQTVLLGVAGLLLSTAPSANAQCSLSRPYYSPPHHGHHGHHAAVHVRPHISYRPQVHVSYFPQAAMAYPPSPSLISGNFGANSHVDELASRLEILMNQLCLDLYYNYSHNPGFAETYAEAYGLYQMARDIHAAEHNMDRVTMQQQLAGADALFHHIEGDLRGWSRIPRRQIGTLGILTKMEMAEEALHHLMEDVGVSLSQALEEPPLPQTFAPQSQGLSIAPPPPLP